MFQLILGYSILTLIFYIHFSITGNKRYWQANRILIAFISIYLFLNVIASLFISWYGGYLTAVISFYNDRLNLFFLLRISLTLVLLTIPILNIWYKFRMSNTLQIFILTAIIIYLGIELVAYFLSRKGSLLFNQTTYEPGWHTTIANDVNPIVLLCVLISGLLLNLLIVKYSLLPELKN